MLVGEICNRDVVFVDKRSSLREVAGLMREYHVGDVVVVEQRDGAKFPVGIITDRDIVIELLAKEVGLDAVDAGEVMSEDLLSASEADEMMDVVKLMKSRGVRRVPVVDKRGTLVGILAVDDLIELVAEQLTDLVGLILRGQKRERMLRR